MSRSCLGSDTIAAGLGVNLESETLIRGWVPRAAF